MNNSIKQDENNCHNIDNNNDKCNNEINNDNNILNNSNNLNVMNYSVLYALYFRMAYGGKEHDLEMIKSYIKLWNKRFHNNSNKKINNMTIKTVSLFIKPLELDEWDLSAIDYHTNLNFIDFIIKKFPELTKQDIQNIIWIASSSINTRILNNNSNSNSNNTYIQENWIKIKSYVEKTQKYLLESNI